MDVGALGDRWMERNLGGEEGWESSAQACRCSCAAEAKERDGRERRGTVPGTAAPLKSSTETHKAGCDAKVHSGSKRQLPCLH